MKRSFEVTSLSVKYENPWMRVIELKTRTDGKNGIYGVVERSDSVTVIIETDDNKVLFVRQFRYPTNNYSWEIPMGGINPGELPKDRAIRELEEETGCSVELERIGEFYPVPGLTPQKAYVYYGTISYEEIKSIIEYDEKTDEITERKFFSQDDIKAMIASHEITDGFTLCSLFIFARR